MKDEIKEINITFPGQILDYVDTKEHLLELFNYITNLQEELEEEKRIEQASLDTINNLQEENERLKEVEKEHKNCTRKHWQQKCAEHCANEIIYKSRNEKAIELINAWLEGLNNDDIIILLNDLGNVLQGSDKNE